MGGSIGKLFQPTVDAEGNKSPSQLQQGLGSGIQQGFAAQDDARARIAQRGGPSPIQVSQPQVSPELLQPSGYLDSARKRFAPQNPLDELLFYGGGR